MLLYFNRFFSSANIRPIRPSSPRSFIISSLLTSSYFFSLLTRATVFLRSATAYIHISIFRLSFFPVVYYSRFCCFRIVPTFQSLYEFRLSDGNIISLNADSGISVENLASAYPSGKRVSSDRFRKCDNIRAVLLTEKTTMHAYLLVLYRKHATALRLFPAVFGFYLISFCSRYYYLFTTRTRRTSPRDEVRYNNNNITIIEFLIASSQ